MERITLDLVTEELPLTVCNAFWYPKEKRITSYEKFKLLSVKGGLLVREFDEIFSDLFSSTKERHKELVQICKDLGKNLGGVFSKYLDELVKAGFVKRDFTWNLKTGNEGKLSRFRLSDNYVRFYLKYVAVNRSKIDKDLFSNSMAQLPGWEGIMGLQFENLVVHNRKSLWELLGISPEEIVMEGPFFQTPTTKQAGCQIDYMVQTRFQNLYVCEIKFSKNLISKKIIEEMEKKLKNLKIPKHCSIRPVLIHVNGVEECVLDERYFDKIIDFGELLS